MIIAKIVGYTARHVNAIEEAVRGMGWGYADQIQDLLNVNFSGFFD